VVVRASFSSRLEELVATSTDATLPVVRARGVQLDIPADRSGLLRRRGATVRAVHGLDVGIRAGEALWLVGQSGDGGAEAGRLLSLQLLPTAGAVELDGRPVTTARGKSLAAARRQVVRLDPGAVPAVDPKRTAAEVVAAAAAGSTRSVRDGHTTAARHLLERVGLPADHVDVRTGALTEPERRLVEVGRQLAAQPRVVVYQPAWTDVSDRDNDPVWVALTRLRDEGPVVLVLVSTVLPDHLGPGERALVMCGGRVVEALGPGDLDQPLHPFTVSLASPDAGDQRDGREVVGSGRAVTDRSRIDQGCPFRASCPWAKARCASEMPKLERPLGATHDVACHFPEDPSRPQGGRASGERSQGSEGGTAVRVVPPGLPDEPTAREFAEG
jgi:ABC-type glutathione transport system ATPase component